MRTPPRGQIRNYRASWGVFRDRRPEMYGALTTLDGARVHAAVTAASAASAASAAAANGSAAASASA
jgi:hypothetical protein